MKEMLWLTKICRMTMNHQGCLNNLFRNRWKEQVTQLHNVNPGSEPVDEAEESINIVEGDNAMNTETNETESQETILKCYKHQGSHPIDNILTDLNTGITTRSGFKNLCAFTAFLSMIEPKKVNEALQDAYW